MIKKNVSLVTGHWTRSPLHVDSLHVVLDMDPSLSVVDNPLYVAPPVGGPSLRVVPQDEKIPDFVAFMFSQLQPGVTQRSVRTLDDLRALKCERPEFEKAVLAYMKQEGLDPNSSYMAAVKAPEVGAAWPTNDESSSDPTSPPEAPTERPKPPKLAYPGTVTASAITVLGDLPQGAVNTIMSAFSHGLPWGQVLQGAARSSTGNAGVDPQVQVLQERGENFRATSMTFLNVMATFDAATLQAVKDCGKMVHQHCTSNGDDDDGFLTCARDFVANNPECISPIRGQEVIKDSNYAFIGIAAIIVAHKLGQCLGIGQSTDPGLKTVLDARLGSTHPLNSQILNHLGVPEPEPGRVQKGLTLVGEVTRLTRVAKWAQAGYHRLEAYFVSPTELFSMPEQESFKCAGSSYHVLTQAEMDDANKIMSRITYKAAPMDSSSSAFVRNLADFTTQIAAPLKLDAYSNHQAQFARLLQIAEKAGPEKVETVIEALKKLVVFGNVVVAKAAINALGKYAKDTLKSLQSNTSIREVFRQSFYGDVKPNIKQEKLLVWELQRYENAQTAMRALEDLRDTFDQTHVKSQDESSLEAQPNSLLRGVTLEEIQSKCHNPLRTKEGSVATELHALGVEYSLVGSVGRAVDEFRTYAGAFSFFTSDFIADRLNPQNQLTKLMTTLFFFAFQKS